MGWISSFLVAFQAELVAALREQEQVYPRGSYGWKIPDFDIHCKG